MTQRRLVVVLVCAAARRAVRGAPAEGTGEAGVLATQKLMMDNQFVRASS